MKNELSVRMIMWSVVFSVLRATAMAASSALLIVRLSGCDFMLICVMEFLFGLTTSAPCVGLPLTCEPSV